MRTWTAVLDRTAVLFLGVAAGFAIGIAFGGGVTPTPVSIAPVAVAPAMPGARVPAAVAPPPPTATPGKTEAPAQTASVAAPESALPVQRGLLETVTTGGHVRVGVFGDSFGDGVWSGLNRLLPEKDGYDVVKFSKQATGFTRYKSLNLERHAQEQLGDAPIDVAVVSYGANDTQGVIDRDGHYAALMSPGWQKEIGARVEAFVGVLRAHGAMVYWVGLPRMRKASFDADIANMDAFYAARMAALGVPFIDTRPAASDAAGNYAAYLPDPRDGHQVLMRADDGIHMSMNGYVWITRGLAARIKAYVDAARAQAGVAPPPQTALAAAVPAEPVRPRPVAAPPKPSAEDRAAPRPDRPKPAAEKKPAREADRSDEPVVRPKPAADRPKPAADRPKPASDRPAADKVKPAWLRTDEDPPLRPAGGATP